MLTKTSLSAIRALLYLSQAEPLVLVSPKRMGEVLGESPTYLAKVARTLVKVGILRARKGVNGGVQLNQAPGTITLLAIVEACQGTLVGDYCRVQSDPSLTCAYHQAAMELHRAIIEVLSRWTLAKLALKPRPLGPQVSDTQCVMLGDRQSPTTLAAGLVKLPGVE